MKTILHGSVGLACLLLVNQAFAHFPILIHDAGLGATSGAVTVTYASGHPFELDLEPVARPQRVRRIDRRGRATDLTANLKPTRFRGEAAGGGWQFTFDPPQGDSVVALDSAPSLNDRQKTIYQEYVKLWVHRERQEGWHQRTGQPLEIVPFTRPYGLRPGMVFTGRLMHKDRPVSGVEVYAERLSERKPDPASLPPEPLITLAVRTDDTGRFVVTLTDPGWWIVGAYVQDLGPVAHEGQTWELEAFAGAWLHVESR